MKPHIGKVMFITSLLVVTAAAQVDGSGTADYVPVWVNTSTLGNSNIFVTQGKVGIGTISPAATLYVAGQNGGSGGSLNAPMAFQASGGAGHESKGVGGTGGPISLSGGPGAGISSTGGAGGTVWINGGAGGHGLVDGGRGGAIEVAAGNAGGNSSGATGGIGASILVAPGSAAEGFHAGSGGSITLQPGTPGSGGTSSGGEGAVLLAPTGGKVGIGEESPANTLEVVTGGTTLADSWTVRSSRRFKINIQPLQGSLDKVQRLQGVSYDRVVDGKHELGVVAEDVERVLPKIVSQDPKTHEVQGVDYSRLTALLIEAVKEQQSQINQLKEQLQKLGAR